VFGIVRVVEGILVGVKLLVMDHGKNLWIDLLNLDLRRPTDAMSSDTIFAIRQVTAGNHENGEFFSIPADLSRWCSNRSQHVFKAYVRSEPSLPLLLGIPPSRSFASLPAQA
jgi:hypothetical protein